MRRQKGYTLFELLIGLAFVAAVGLALTIGYVAVHFIMKYW